MSTVGITFTGTAANESVDGTALFDTLDGAGGHDTLRGLAGNDSLLGGDGNDLIYGGNDQDSLYGGKGNDTLYGDSGDDLLEDGAGDDQVYGGAGADTLRANAGTDALDGGSASDWLQRDRNVISYQNFGVGVLVDLQFGAGSAGANSQTLSNLQIVIGGTGNDTLRGFHTTFGNGFEEVDLIEEYAPGAGNDSIDGRGGPDILRYDLTGASGPVNVDLDAGTASDGQGGNDVFTGIEGVWGTPFNDSLVGSDVVDETFRGGAGNDTIDGGLGFDIADYSADPAGVAIDFFAGSFVDGTGAHDTLLNIDGVVGSRFDDTITGSAGASPTLFECGAGNDVIDGSSGPQDEVTYAHSPMSGVFVDLVSESASQDGWFGADTLYGIEHVTGTLLFDDTIYGDSNDNRLQGLGGNDLLSGSDGFDTLLGGSGSDNLYGDNGDDLLDGDIDLAGVDDFSYDYLDGGLGDDTLKGGWYDWLAGGDGYDLIIANGQLTIDYSSLVGPIHVMLKDVTLGEDGQVFEATDSVPGFDSTDTVRGIRLTIYGTTQGDSLEGATGPAFNYDAAYDASDNFLAGDGDDTISGRAGYDTLYGDAGNDSILGGDDDDQLAGGNGDDTLDGGAGYDMLFGSLGNDLIDGGADNDLLTYESSGVLGIVVNMVDGQVIKGSEVDAFSNIEIVNGSNGDDHFIGDASTNQFSGRAGNDTFDASGGVDVIDYRDGSIPNGTGVVVVLPSDTVTAGSASDGRGGTDTIYFGAAEQLFGSYGPDTLTGADAADAESIWGSWGDDMVLGRGGDDVLFGEYGDDSLDGGSGNDSIFGGDGNDTLRPGSGNDSVVGDNGHDWVFYDDLGGGIVVDLAAQRVTKPGGLDTIAGVEVIIGTDFADSFAGDANDNWFVGLGGNDSFSASDGIDTVSYGPADLPPGVGATVVLAPNASTPGTGHDGFGGIDVIDPGAADVLAGSDGPDSLTGSPVFAIVSGIVGHDRIAGYGGNDTLRGLDGNDFLDGLDDHDSLDGASGNDTIWGGAGNDTLVPGTGTDSADGGTGTDLAIVGAARSAYVIEQVGADLRINRGGIDSVLIHDVENVQFSDVTLSFATLQSQAGLLLIGTPNPDTLAGGSGRDSIVGLAAADSMSGGDGDDTIVAGDGADTVDGGNGNDLVELPFAQAQYIVTMISGDLLLTRGADSVRITPATENVRFSDTTQTFAQLVPPLNLNLVGTPGNDTLTGASADDTISGLGGNDSLIGNGGDDRLIPGSGFDTADGGGGSDLVVLAFARSAYVIERVGPDLRINRGGLESVLARDVDSFQFSDVTVPLAALSAQTGVLLIGTPGPDTLVGGAGFDSIDGLAGADAIFGGDRDDTIVAGLGADTVDGGAGNDRVELPFPRADYATSRVGLDLQLSRGSDSVRITPATESVRFSDTTVSFAQLAPPVGLTLNGSEDADTLIGGDGADILIGNGGADRLAGNAGNDNLNGGEGDDLLLPGSGSDTVTGGSGVDVVSYADQPAAMTIDVGASTVTKPTGFDLLSGIEGAIGTAFADRLVGDSNDNRFVGGAGNDTFAASAGIDLISFDDPAIPLGVGVIVTVPSSPGTSTTAQDGRGGNDAIEFGAAEQVLGSPGPDSITGAPLGVFGGITVGHDTLMGGTGNDTLLGLSGNDRLQGDDGNDLLIPGDGVDTADGGSGNDTVQMPLARSAYSVQKPGGQLTLVRGGDSVLLQQIEQVQFSDALLSLQAVENFVALSIVGTTGADTLAGNLGNDTLQALGGNDLLRPSGGIDSVDGGDGVDRVDYGALGTGVVVELALQRATEPGGVLDTLIGIEQVTGSAFADRLVGDGDDNRLEGGAGDDTLEGAGGDDTLLGGDGNDTMVTGVGNDSLDGGGGVDTVQLASALSGWTSTVVGDDLLLTRNSGSSALASVRSPFGADPFHVRPAAGPGDSVLLHGIEQVWFSDATLSFEQLLQTAARSLTGTDASETLEGGGGNDTLRGLGGDDLLRDGPGSDSYDGGEGYDVIAFGGSGAVVANMALRTATRGGDTDTFTSIEAMFGGDGNDSLRGADALPHERSDTLRGRGGNDTIDGAGGVDNAEWSGPRANYALAKTGPNTWRVTDNVTTDGNEGADTVSNTERFVFADQMVAFGARAEELARVAFVLWTKDIVGSPALFSRGLSFYDVGYDFETMSIVALQFWTGDSDAQLAQRLITNSGSTKTVAQLLATMAANGGSVEGRAAALREIALDPATTLLIEQSNIREVGLVADNAVPGFGVLFSLLPG